MPGLDARRFLQKSLADLDAVHGSHPDVKAKKIGGSWMPEAEPSKAMKPVPKKKPSPGKPPIDPPTPVPKAEYLPQPNR